MKCYIHPGRDAVATCSSCGKGLCSECAEKYQVPTCQPCTESINQQVIAERKKPIVMTAIVAAISLFIGFSTYSDARALLFTWGILGAYWGWALVKPMLFSAILGTAFFRGTGFVLGFMLVALAMGLGMFAGPILLAKNIYEYLRDKKIADSAKSSA